MSALADFVVTEAGFLLGALFLLLAFKLVNGDINAQKLLDNKETGAVSPERVQALVITVGVAGYLLATAAIEPVHFSAIPDAVLAVLFGSQAGYLGLKGKNLFLKGGQQ